MSSPTATMDFNRIVASEHPTPQSLTSEIASELDLRGWCIVQPTGDGATELLAIARSLGTIQSHIRADTNGMTGNFASVDQTWKAYKSEYVGLSQERMDPHTDGAFLTGATAVEGMLHPVDPPALILLQCVHPAYRGGHHLVVDGQAIVDAMLDTDPRLVRALMTPGCVAVCRDNQLSRLAPVLSPAPDNRLRLRFRYDSKTYAAPDAVEALRLFHELSNDPQLVQCVRQSPGEILVFDNHRALHGRQAFDNHPERPPRLLRRVWIRSYDGTPLVGVEGQSASQRVLDAYTPYGPVESALAAAPSPFVRTGIQITPPA